jgi:hypothetical protein
MNEDFLENDIDGDVGGLLQRAKRQRRQPNPSGAASVLLSLHLFSTFSLYTLSRQTDCHIFRKGFPHSSFGCGVRVCEPAACGARQWCSALTAAWGAALRRAKDSDSDSSSDSSDDAPRQAAKRPAPSSSSSSSSSSSDEEEVVKKQAASKKKTTIESSSDSDD